LFRKLILFLSLATVTLSVKAQAPGCFVLESFLADACGSPEGLNEMVRFRVGPAAINTASLTVTWPNVSNSWQGVCQNATTANLVAQLNASITGCGEIIEPTNGILPAGATVILFTSAFFDPAANPFINLNETIYAIFQCGNETGGNFANSGPNPRTLTLGFGGSCSQQATYIPDQLTGGDGATVEVSSAGLISYSNSGCQGLFEMPDPSWDPPGPLCSTEPSFDLNDFVSGTPGGTWSGPNQVNGLVDPSTLNGTYSFTYTVTPAGCATPVSETQSIIITAAGDPSWDANVSLCDNAAPLDLNTLVSGSTGGSWSGPGVIGNTFNPIGLAGPQAITYTIGTGACQSTQTNNITVVAGGNPAWTTLTVCESSPTIDLNQQLNGTPGGTWSGTGVSGSLFNPAGLNGNVAITYTLGSGNCQVSSTQNIAVITVADASWNSPGSICSNAAPIDLNAFITGSPNGGFSGPGVTFNTFNPQGLSGSIDITYLVGAPGCTDSQNRTLTIIEAPDASWAFANPQICETAPALNLAPLLNGLPGGTWSGTGVSGSSFSPLGLAGPIDLSYTVSQNGCQSSLSNTIEVIPPPTILFTAPNIICESAQNVSISTWNSGVPGGIWQGPGVVGEVFNPTGLVGTIQLDYSIIAGGCSSSGTLLIDILPTLPAITVSGPTEYCSAIGPQQLTANGATGEVFWFDNPELLFPVASGTTFTPPLSDIPQTLYVVQSDGLCNSPAFELTVTQTQSPEPPISEDTVRWCSGQSIPIINAFANNTIVWYADAAGTIEVDQGPTYSPAAGTTEVFLRAENLECVSEMIRVVLEEKEAVTADILGDEVVYACFPSALELSSANADLNQWSTGDFSQSIWVNREGVIYLSRTGECNTAIDSVRVEDVSFDVAFALVNLESFAPVSLPVVNLSSDSENCTWFIDGQPTELQPDGGLLFQNDTIYTVKLECENEFGCKESMEQKVVIGFIQMLFPNTFTPNEDGLNDIFRPAMYGISSLEMSIYNRWGELIYFNNTLEAGWDGKVSGRDAPDDVYTFSVLARDKNAKIIRERGRIQLVR
jgi:gliding motility-associated-like protein